MDATINQTVNVNAFYFKGGKNIRSFPRQIELGSERFTFNDGLQYVVHRGPHVVKLFDMTDGHTTYRLRQEDDIWTLVGTRLQAA